MKTAMTTDTAEGTWKQDGEDKNKIVVTPSEGESVTFEINGNELNFEMEGNQVVLKK